MKRLAGTLLVLISISLTPVEAQILGESLKARLASPSSDPLRVVATFERVPTTLDRALIGSVSSRSQFLRALPMALLETNKAGVTKLLGTPGLKSLYLDERLEYYLHESVARIGADRARRELGADGSGIGIAVIDSGVDATHPDLQFGTKVVQNVKIAGLSAEDTPTGTAIVQVVENLPNSDTTSGHGTHVASTAAGSGDASNGAFTGVAPGAHLIGIGTGDTLFVFYALEGFDYAISNRDRYNIKVITNSWGSTMAPGEAFDPHHPINAASKTAHEKGMTVLFAAGNSGPGTDTLNRYSVAPWVIGVANGLKDGETLANSSSRGRYEDDFYHPTVTAPGTDIVAARAPNTVLPALGLIDGDLDLDPAWVPYYTHMSGTSMACPHVAGVIALLYQVRPDMTPDLAKRIVVNTATPMPNYRKYAVGAGMVDAYAAVKQAKAIKNIKSYKDPRTGKTIDVYVVESVVTGTVGPAAGAYNDISNQNHDFAVLDGAVFLDTKLIWDNYAHDLDLYVQRDVNGTWVDVGNSQDIQALTMTAIEGVAVDYPQVGMWRARARGWVNTLQSYRLTIQQYFPLK